MGIVYTTQGKFEDALAYYAKALQIRKDALGDEHPDVGTTPRNPRYVDMRVLDSPDVNKRCSMGSYSGTATVPG